MLKDLMYVELPFCVAQVNQDLHGLPIRRDHVFVTLSIVQFVIDLDLLGLILHRGLAFMT